MPAVKDSRGKSHPLGPKISETAEADCLLELSSERWAVVATRGVKTSRIRDGDASDGRWEFWIWNGELGLTEMVDFGKMVAADLIVTVQRRTGKRTELLAKWRKGLSGYPAALVALRDYQKSLAANRLGRHPVRKEGMPHVAS